MDYLHGSRPEMPRRLAAAFDPGRRLTADVRRATLSGRDGVRQFEEGSSLAGYRGSSHTDGPLTAEDAATVDHDPSPSMP